MARFDLGLSLEEFGQMTPRMFDALLERRHIEFRYQLLAAATVAATVINVNRRPSDPPVSPYDFVIEETPRDLAKKNIASLFAMVGTGEPERFDNMRRRAIAGLKQEGFSDAEEIFREVFSAWKDNGNAPNSRRDT
jgi:tetraacyldisaccharide-1-P 4'-kinase